MADTIMEIRGRVAAAVEGGGALDVPVVAHEPGQGDLPTPAAVTISTVSITPTAFVFAVRCYVAVSIGAETALETLEDVTQTVDSNLAVGGDYGPSDWTFSYERDLGLLMSESQVQTLRDW
jgi:hypothetical protein